MLFHKCEIGTMYYKRFVVQSCTAVSSTRMMSIRSYVGSTESCKRANTAVFQYYLVDDFCLGKGCNVRTLICKKTFRNLMHFHKESNL